MVHKSSFLILVEGILEWWNDGLLSTDEAIDKIRFHLDYLDSFSEEKK